jgi:26-hydroxylase
MLQLQGLVWNLITAICNTSCSSNVILVVVLVILAFVRLCQIVREIRSLPPGPWGFPVIGYLPFLKGNVHHLHYSDLASKYGTMFSTRLGNQLVVVLSDHKMIREAFRREEFTGRPQTQFTNILGGYGEQSFVMFEKYIEDISRLCR